MRIVEIEYRKPANLLIAALQESCIKLITEPEKNGINSLERLSELIQQYAEKLQIGFKKCKLENLSFDYGNYVTFENFSLWYKDESPMISIMARPDRFEQCFRKYDELKKLPDSNKVLFQ